MIEKIHEIQKILDVIKEGIEAASKPKLNMFELMTDKELILYLANKCQTFEVPLDVLLKLEIIIRTKEV